jgi:hypothetical protein
MTVEAKFEAESIEEVSVAELFVVETFEADVAVWDAVLADQNVKDPVDCNKALEARSSTRVATTPGLEDNLSKV